jgi:hypothetical protein
MDVLAMKRAIQWSNGSHGVLQMVGPWEHLHLLLIRKSPMSIGLVVIFITQLVRPWNNVRQSVLRDLIVLYIITFTEAPIRIAGLKIILLIVGNQIIFLIHILSSLHSVRLLLVTLQRKWQDGNTRVAGEIVTRAEVYLIDYQMLIQLKNVSSKLRPQDIIPLVTSILVSAGLAIIQIGIQWETQAAANLLVEDVHSRFILHNNLSNIGQ